MEIIKDILFLISHIKGVYLNLEYKTGMILGKCTLEDCLLVDDKLKDIGFVKTKENKYGIEYEKINVTGTYKYIHKVCILHKNSGKHILQSYDSELIDEKNIGNTCVGLTGYEMKLFLKKMKQMGLYSK